MTTETQELKPLPCPLCGGKVVISQEPHDNGCVAGMYYLHHTARGSGRFCHLTYGGHFDTKAEILAAWNTRPTEDRLVGALEEAERALEELVATVRGECPRLLSEDSGGNASLSEQVDAALTRIRAAKGGEDG